jgi:hypothetical protein
MALSKAKIQEYNDLRKQIGDTAYIDEAIKTNPKVKTLFESLRQEGVDDTAILDEYFKQKNIFRLPSTQWKGMTPQVQKSYQQNYNIEIVPVGKPQAEATQPQEQGFGGKLLEGFKGKPGRELTETMRAGTRKMFGVIPSAERIEDIAYNQSRAELGKILSEGKLSTKAGILNDLGQERGQKLIDYLEQITKGKAFSPHNTRMALGKIEGEGKKLSEVGLARATVAFIERAVSPSNVFVPVELAMNLAGVGILGKVASGLAGNAVRKGLSEAVANKTMTAEQASKVFKEYQSIMKNTPSETIVEIVKGNAPMPKVPGQALSKSAQQYGKTIGQTTQDVLTRKPFMEQEIKSQSPKTEQNLEEAIPRTPEDYTEIDTPGIRTEIEKIKANASAELMKRYDREQKVEAQRGADGVITQLGSDWHRKLSAVLRKQSSATNQLNELGVLHNLTDINATDQMIIDALKAKVSVRTRINKAMGRGKIQFSETGDPILDIPADFTAPIEKIPPQEKVIEQPIEKAPEKPIESLPKVEATDIPQEQAIPSAEAPKEPTKPMSAEQRVVASGKELTPQAVVDKMTPDELADVVSTPIDVYKHRDLSPEAYAVFTHKVREKGFENPLVTEKNIEDYLGKVRKLTTFDEKPSEYRSIYEDVFAEPPRYADAQRKIEQLLGIEHDKAIAVAGKMDKGTRTLFDETVHTYATRKAQAEPTPTVEPKAETPILEAPKVSPEEATQTINDPQDYPPQQVKTNEIVARPEDFQYKRMDNKTTGTNAKEKINDKWDYQQAGLVQVWQPINPEQYGLKQGEKYIVVNGHHRFELANEQNISKLNVQIMREIDGISKEEAFLKGAKMNIKDNRGDIGDNLKIFETERDARRTLGENEPQGERNSYTGDARRAYIIANDGELSLINAFKNGEITAKQAATIAEIAPRNEGEQTLGTNLVRTYNINDKKESLDQLAEMIKATRLFKPKEKGAEQLSMFGQDDTAISEAKDISDVAIELKGKLVKTRDYLKTILSGEKKGIRNDPMLTGENGEQIVDIKNPASLVAKIKDLDVEIAKWDSWQSTSRTESGSPMNQIMARLAEKGKEPTLINMDLGAKSEDIDDPVAMAKKKLDDFVDRRAEEVGKNIEEKAPSGGLSLRIIRKKGGQDGKLPKEPPIANKELAETLATGGKSNYAKSKELLNRQINNAWNILTDRFEPELMRMKKKFPEAIPQFVDNVRTQIIPMATRATEFADKALYAVWGDITGDSRKYLMRMIGMRALQSRKAMGLPVSRDIPLDVLQKEIADMATLLQKFDEGKLVLERVEAFKELMHDIGENLVARKKLKVEALDAQDFYFPFTPEEYFQDYPSMSRKARQAFRPYTLEAKGTMRDVVMTEDAARVYLAQVHMDDAVDDFTIRNLKQFDVYAKVLRSKTDDELLAIFHNEDFNIKPNNIYKIDGKPYKAYQEIPGNIKYVGDIVNKKQLVEESIPDIIAHGENQSDDEILSRIESLRRGLIVGSKHKSYLIPEPIADKLLQLKPPSEEIIPGMYDAVRMTRLWKGGTILYAGIPYQTLNIAGDLYNVFITSEGAFKPDIIKSSTKILNYVKHPARYGDHYLNQFEKDVLRIAQEKDVLGSGFMSEWRSASRPLNVPGYQKVRTKWERFNYSRESIPRLIELTYQWDRHVKGKGFVGEAFKKDIANLDAESSAAYIARNATIDYRAVPDWYRRHMNGFWFPFLTWSHKNVINTVKNFRTPLGAAKMGLKIGVPFAAAYIYNNSGDRKYIYDRLGYFQQRASTFIIKGEDLDDDGKPEQAWIFSPQMPWDSATEIMGWSKLVPLINQVQRGMITPEDAAKTFLSGVAGKEPVRHLARMTTPIAQFLIGVTMNEDPVDKQPIVPENLRNITDAQKYPYWRNYLLEKTLSPFGQYIRQADKGEATNAFGIFSKGPLDFPRAFGLYKVNLVANEAKELLKLASKEEAQFAYWLYRYKQEYIRGNKEGMDEVKRKAEEKGYKIPYKSIVRMKKSETVEKKKILHKMSVGDESNYIDAIDDMGADSPISNLMEKATSAYISSDQKKDYQKTLDEMLWKQALKEAKRFKIPVPTEEENTPPTE